jgi:hypothetical protein
MYSRKNWLGLSIRRWLFPIHNALTMCKIFTNNSRFALPLLLSLLSLVPYCDLSAQSYWDAIFELGYDSTTKKVSNSAACRRIEDIYRFRELVSQKLTAEKDLLKLLQNLDSRITSLDAANVYDFLPFTDAEGQWRAIGVRGQSDLNAYQLKMIDPKIEKWRKSSVDDYSTIAGSQAHFGDIGMGIFIRPIRQDSFRFLTDTRLHLNDIPVANIMRVINGMLTTTWSYATGAAKPPPDFIDNYALDRQSLKILNGVSRDFPDLFRIILKYWDVENILSSQLANTGDFLSFNLRAGLNHDAFSKHYPELGKFLNKWQEIVQFKARIFDNQNQLMGMVQLDSLNNIFTVQFRILRDRFIPLQGTGILKTNNGFTLIGMDSAKFRVICDIHLNIVGMKIKIETLPVILDYQHSDAGPHLMASMEQVPQKVQAGGSVYGVIPIWMVDLMIPSNVQEIINSFFQTLARANDGKGSMLMIRSFPEQISKQNVLLKTDAEVLANGTIKLGFNLQRKFFAIPPELLVETQAFKEQLWNALYHDFQKVRTQRGYQ